METKKEIRAFVRVALKEIMERMLDHLSEPAEETTAEADQKKQIGLFVNQQEEPKKRQRIYFRNGIKIKLVGKQERFYSSEKDFVEEITNRRFPPRKHCFTIGKHGAVKSHSELIALIRKRLEELLYNTGSIQKIEYVSKLSPDRQEYTSYAEPQTKGE